MTRALLSCVGENRAGWFDKMENLVLSVRRFGDRLATMPIVVNVVDGVDAGFRGRIEALDAEVRVVAPVDRRLPSSNKLRMFDLAQRDDFDVLLMVDCDVIVMGDLSAELGDGRTVRALPGGRSHIAPDAWRRLYEAAGLPEPDRSMVLSVSGERSHPYFNSGVLFVPRHEAATLGRAWWQRIEWLLDEGAPLLGVPRLKRDQIPLAIALAELSIDVDPLPPPLNLSTTTARPAARLGGRWGPPFVFHYHRGIDEDGFLTRSPLAGVNEWFDRFNQARAEHTGRPYTGMAPLSVRGRAAALLDSRPSLRRAVERARGRGR